jgi:hypothetical protein
MRHPRFQAPVNQRVCHQIKGSVGAHQRPHHTAAYGIIVGRACPTMLVTIPNSPAVNLHVLISRASTARVPASGAPTSLLHRSVEGWRPQRRGFRPVGWRLPVEEEV